MTKDTSEIPLWIGDAKFRLEAVTGSHQHRHLADDRVWERHITQFLLWALPKLRDPVLFDVGASVGYYSVLAAKFGAQVVAFEPNPEVREVLQRNVARNDCQGVTIDHRILGDGRSRLRLVEPTDFDEGGYAVDADEDSEDASTTIDAYCDATGSTPSIIKMDAEGRDLDVIKGSLGTLRRAGPPVIFEFQVCKIAALSGTRPEDLFRELQEIGYTPYLFRGHTSSCAEAVDFEILQRIFDIGVERQNAGSWDVLLWPPQMRSLIKRFEMPA